MNIKELYSFRFFTFASPKGMQTSTKWVPKIPWKENKTAIFDHGTLRSDTNNREALLSNSKDPKQCSSETSFIDEICIGQDSAVEPSKHELQYPFARRDCIQRTPPGMGALSLIDLEV